VPGWGDAASRHEDVESIALHTQSDTAEGALGGAGLGFLVAGPIGAALGAALGANAFVTFALVLKDGQRMLCHGSRSVLQVLEIAVARAKFLPTKRP